MSASKNIIVQSCILHEDTHSLYMVRYKDKPLWLRKWNQQLPEVALNRLVYLYNSGQEFPRLHRTIRLGDTPGLLLEPCIGIPITTLQSSLSPKTIYEIATQILDTMRRTETSFVSMEGMLLNEQGQVFNCAPTLPQKTSTMHNDGVWTLGMWVLSKVCPVSTEHLYTFMQQQNAQQYNTALNKILTRLELGLPNQQWTNSAIQTIAHMCAFSPKQRWNAETSLKMMEAYAGQGIGLSLPVFCEQHRRIFGEHKYPSGPLTGQTLSFVPWIKKENEAETTTLSWKQTLKQTWHTPSNRRFLFGSTGISFLLLHLLTSLFMWMLPPTTATEASSNRIAFEVHHDGVRKITLQNEAEQSTVAKLSRSKRELTVNIDVGTYRFEVEHQNKRWTTFLELTENTRVECQQAVESVECTANNRMIQWD